MSINFQMKLFWNTNENISVKNVKTKTFFISSSLMTAEGKRKLEKEPYSFSNYITGQHKSILTKKNPPLTTCTLTKLKLGAHSPGKRGQVLLEQIQKSVEQTPFWEGHRILEWFQLKQTQKSSSTCYTSPCYNLGHLQLDDQFAQNLLS